MRGARTTCYRRTALSVVPLMVLSLAVGCSGGGAQDRTPTGAGVAAVQAAIPALERARNASMTEIARVLKAAAAVDARDTAAVKGDRAAVRRLVEAAPFTRSVVDASARSLVSGAASYASAVEVLSAAADRAGLPDDQRQALAGVVSAARAEAAADAELARVASERWSKFGTLGALELKWLQRARAGWYRNQKESADAYVVLTSAVRPSVDRARPELAAVAASRERASAAYALAVARFRKLPISPPG